MNRRPIPENHLFSSGAHFPTFALSGEAPSELVVAISPSVRIVSASFSPSGRNTSVLGSLASASSSSCNRWGIFTQPFGFSDTQRPPDQKNCGYCAHAAFDERRFSILVWLPPR